MQRRFPPPFFWISLPIVLLINVQYISGRPWWCLQGDLVPWSWDTESAHNSQHCIDQYSLTHFLHGLIFYWLLRAMKLGRSSILIVAIWLEVSWEWLENTSFIIERYRAETISLHYYGDSIMNSLFDVLLCIGGVFFAQKFPFMISVATWIAIELLLLWWIRDSLLLNVIMLLYPLDAIREWQGGSHALFMVHGG